MLNSSNVSANSLSHVSSSLFISNNAQSPLSTPSFLSGQELKTNVTPPVIPYQESIGGTTYFYKNDIANSQNLAQTTTTAALNNNVFDGFSSSPSLLPSASSLVLSGSSCSSMLYNNPHNDLSFQAHNGLNLSDTNSFSLAPNAMYNSPNNLYMPHAQFLPNLSLSTISQLESESHQSSPYFGEPNLKRHLCPLSHLTAKTIPNTAPLLIDVDRYHTLIPLEPDIPDQRSEANQSPVNHQHNAAVNHYQTGTVNSGGMIDGYKKTLYSCTDSSDGNTYCMVRIHGYSLASIKMRKALNNWKKFDQIWCVRLREVFTTTAFGDSSLIFIYDYLPTFVTLKEYLTLTANNNLINSYKHPTSKLDSFGQKYSYNKSQSYSNNSSGSSWYKKNNTTSLSQNGYSASNFHSLEENKIWNILIQITGALRRIHAANLFSGAGLVLNTTKILIDPMDQKVRINCLGMYEIMTNDNEMTSSTSNIVNFQQEDIKALGVFILSLIYPPSTQSSNISYPNSTSLPQIDQSQMSSNPGNNNKWLISAFKHVITAQKYCDDLKNILLYLLTPPSQQQQPINDQLHNLKKVSLGTMGLKLKSLNDLMPMIGARYYTHIENVTRQYSYVKDQLSLESDNGRLFRLLCKINTIVERPEHNIDASWSETGDRYLLKLFRDFVFFGRKPGDGTPFLDLAHVITHLNKLDIGSPERITLCSRDERNIIIVSYSDLKKCLQTSFFELFPSDPN